VDKKKINYFFNYYLKGNGILNLLQHEWTLNRLRPGHQCFTPIILATQVAEIRRIWVWSQPEQNSSRDPVSKKTHYRKGLV
jgi:hypothetical protein